MSEVRVKPWPLAVAGSLLVHVSALTGIYLAPELGVGGAAASARVGVGAAGEFDTIPLYLMPDELPADVAAKLAADQAAAAKSKPLPEDRPPEVEPEVAVKPPEKVPIPIQLGAVDGPKIETKEWLKHDSPHEHGAMQSSVTQPQQDLKAEVAPQGTPGVGGADGQNQPNQKTEQADTKPRPSETKVAPQPPTAVPTPATDRAVAPAVEPRPKATTAEPVERAPIVEIKPTRDVPEGPSKTEIKAGNSGGKTPKDVRNASEPRVQPVEAVAPIATPVSAAAGNAPGGAADAAKPSPADSRAPGAPGVPTASKTVAADRDSDAASVKRSAVFRNGKVEAGEGLDIRTVRPDLSLTSRALQRPRNPTLEIIFGKDGRAKKVRVLKSSGYPSDVDEPVMTALYNWRAKGKVLDQLPARADASVSLEITIIFE